MQARKVRIHVISALAGAILALCACSEPASPAEPIRSPTSAEVPMPQAPPYTLLVTVQAGGDCREIGNRWEVLGGSSGDKPKLLGEAGMRTRTESDPPGLIPCQFEFSVEGLPATDRYFVVDKTINRGWGPWSLAALRSRNWRVTVAITDLD